MLKDKIEKQNNNKNLEWTQVNLPNLQSKTLSHEIRITP